MQNLGFTPDQFETTPFRLSTGDAYAVPARCCGRKAEKGAESVIGLIRLLVRRFPVLQRLLGEESFMRAACSYVLTHPLQRGGLLYFGETFPTFLRSLGGATSIEYLADIASLEWARYKACYALPVVPAVVSPPLGCRVHSCRGCASRSIPRYRSSPRVFLL